MVLTNQRQGQENINLWMKLKQMVLQIVIKRLTPWRQTKASSCTERPYKTHSSTTYPSVQASTVVPSMNLSRTWAAGDARGRTRDCTQGSVTAWMMKTVKHRNGSDSRKKMCSTQSCYDLPVHTDHDARATWRKTQRTNKHGVRTQTRTSLGNIEEATGSGGHCDGPVLPRDLHPVLPPRFTHQRPAPWRQNKQEQTDTGASKTSPPAGHLLRGQHCQSTPVQISARSEILHCECHRDSPGDFPPWGGQTVSMHSPGHPAVVEELPGPGDSREPLLHRHLHSQCHHTDWILYTYSLHCGLRDIIREFNKRGSCDHICYRWVECTTQEGAVIIYVIGEHEV